MYRYKVSVESTYQEVHDQFRTKWLEEVVIAELAMADLYHLLLVF